jgi:hypothetical protein
MADMSTLGPRLSRMATLPGALDALNEISMGLSTRASARFVKLALSGVNPLTGGGGGEGEGDSVTTPNNKSNNNSTPGLLAPSVVASRSSFTSSSSPFSLPSDGPSFSSSSYVSASGPGKGPGMGVGVGLGSRPVTVASPFVASGPDRKRGAYPGVESNSTTTFMDWPWSTAVSAAEACRAWALGEDAVWVGGGERKGGLGGSHHRPRTQTSTDRMNRPRASYNHATRNHHQSTTTTSDVTTQMLATSNVAVPLGLALQVAAEAATVGAESLRAAATAWDAAARAARDVGRDV